MRMDRVPKKILNERVEVAALLRALDVLHAGSNILVSVLPVWMNVLVEEIRFII